MWKNLLIFFFLNLLAEGVDVQNQTYINILNIKSDLTSVGSQFTTDCTYVEDLNDFSKIPGCQIFDEFDFDKGSKEGHDLGFWAPCGLNRTWCTIFWNKTMDSIFNDYVTSYRVWPVRSTFKLDEYINDESIGGPAIGGGTNWHEWNPNGTEYPHFNNTENTAFSIKLYKVRDGHFDVNGYISILDYLKVFQSVK